MNKAKEKIFCCYCGMQITILSQWTKEHLVPKSRGGNNSPLNKMDCCKRCNNSRARKELEVWLKELEIKYADSAPDTQAKYYYETLVENVKHWIDYVELHGSKLYTPEHLKRKAHETKY